MLTGQGGQRVTPQPALRDGGVVRSWQRSGPFLVVSRMTSGRCLTDAAEETEEPRTPRACLPPWVSARAERRQVREGQSILERALGWEWGPPTLYPPPRRPDVPFPAHRLCGLASVTSGASPSPGGTGCILCGPSDSHRSDEGASMVQDKPSAARRRAGRSRVCRPMVPSAQSREGH